MADIDAEIAGKILTLLGYDGTTFQNVKVDADGHLQIDALSSALPSGAATEANQDTIITAVQSLQNLVGALHDVNLDELDVNVESSVLPTGAATQTTLAEIESRIGDETNPAAGTTNKLLTDALTALQLIDDLRAALDSVGTDEIDVNVEESVLPTGAATQTTLAEIESRIGDETSPAAGTTNKLLTDALTALQLIDDLRAALDSVGTDEIDVNVEESVLPTGAATQTTLAEIESRIGDETSPAAGTTNKLLTDALTALQLIDDLRAALQSVDTDALQVRGEDQLFSFKEVLGYKLSATISGVNGYISSDLVPSGVIWYVTNIELRDRTSATAATRLVLSHDGEGYDFGGETRAIGVSEYWYWDGQLWADTNDRIYAYFWGGQVGDSCEMTLTGYVMTED